MKIILLKNGPILIYQGNGNGQNQIALCRCGLSANKPLCDGAHVQCDGLPEAEVKLGEHISVEMKGGDS